MKDITVPKDKLLETLRTNRDEHREIFLKAQEAFREKAIQAFETRLEAIRNGDKVTLYIDIPVPEDHTNEYNTVIEMMEWETANEIVLSQQDFRRFVLNRWEWEQSFRANSMSYVGADHE